MLMKKTLLMFALFFTALVMNAQTYYKCTGDNVNVRTGPGKNYAVAINQGFETRCQLFKGNIVRSLGSTRNGFTYVRFSNCGMTGASCYPDNGWVSSQYLRKMTRRCPACGGRGFFNRQELAFASEDIACTTTAMASNIATTAVEWGGCDFLTCLYVANQINVLT